MTTVNKVKEIQKLANLLAQLDEASSAEYKMLKDVTDDFSDLEEEIFNPEITFIVDKLHEKIIKISGSSSSKMDDIKEAVKGNPNVVFATIPKEEERSQSVFDEGELYEQNRIFDDHVPYEKWDGFDETELSREDLEFHRSQQREREEKEKNGSIPVSKKSNRQIAKEDAIMDAKKMRRYLDDSKLQDAVFSFHKRILEVTENLSQVGNIFDNEQDEKAFNDLVFDFSTFWVKMTEESQEKKESEKKSKAKPRAEKGESKAEPKARKAGQLFVGDTVSITEPVEDGEHDEYQPSDIEGVIESIVKEGDETCYFVKTPRGTFEFYGNVLTRKVPKDAPMLTPKAKTGQHIVFKHDVDSPNKNNPKTLKSFGIIKSVKYLSDEEGEIAYNVHWANGETNGIVFESHLTKISEKEYKEGIEKVKKAEANPKPVEPEYKGDSVFKESIEHKIVSRFLGLRAKDAPESLVLNAYTDLQKKITNQEVRKTNPHADLIRAIQGSYYNMLTKADVKKLVLSESLNAKAIYLFDNEKRYSSVKLMSEFAGWTGKSKTVAQIKLFLKKAENVLKEGKSTDPYHDELKAVIKSLSSAKEGQSIVPESIGLSGLGSLFAIKVVK